MEEEIEMAEGMVISHRGEEEIQAPAKEVQRFRETYPDHWIESAPLVAVTAVIGSLVERAEIARFRQEEGTAQALLKEAKRVERIRQARF